MGVVYKAEDPRLRRTVALKFSKAGLGERFQREAKAISALNHPHVATLYDICRHSEASLRDGTTAGDLMLAQSEEVEPQKLNQLAHGQPLPWQLGSSTYRWSPSAADQ